ncbi:MAG: hypothetical protein D6686_13670, partial [Alphaproteobacteria bacterium]
MAEEDRRGTGAPGGRGRLGAARAALAAGDAVGALRALEAAGGALDRPAGRRLLLRAALAAGAPDAALARLAGLDA